jgi:UDP-3-O-[3-hydroxymyristoyl] glucosamine N-acyltransferase
MQENFIQYILKNLDKVIDSLKPLTSVGEIVSFLDTKNHSIKNIREKIVGFKSLSSAKKGDATFCQARGKNGQSKIFSSNASLIICHTSLRNKVRKTNSNLIFVDKPRLWFLRCMKKFIVSDILYDIHPTSVVESTKIGRNVHIGPFVYVGKKVAIGENTIIHGNVTIYNNTCIGNNVIIDSSTVIGADGFGFEKNDSMQWEKFPHVGGIEIHDNVEIGANVCIDRGTLDNTIIGEGTKIDNLVHVAHNVRVGRNCIVVAQSLLGGSCILGDNVHVAMSASIRDGVKIGKNAVIGMGSVVTKDVSDNTVVIGVPARPYKKSLNHNI